MFGTIGIPVRLLSMLLLLIAAALLAVGCGDSSDDGDGASSKSDSTTQSGSEDSTESDSMEEASDDAAYDTYEKGFREVGTQLESVGSKFEAAEDIEDFAAATAVLQTAIASLNALTPPDDIADDHKRLYAALRNTLVEVKKVTPTSTPASDEAAAAAAAQHLEDAGDAADSINQALA